MTNIYFPLIVEWIWQITTLSVSHEHKWSISLIWWEWFCTSQNKELLQQRWWKQRSEAAMREFLYFVIIATVQGVISNIVIYSGYRTWDKQLIVTGVGHRRYHCLDTVSGTLYGNAVFAKSWTWELKNGSTYHYTINNQHHYFYGRLYFFEMLVLWSYTMLR